MAAEGYWNERDMPCLRVHVTDHGERLPGQQIEAVIDTGFSETLLLPEPLVAALGLTSADHTMPVSMADGSTISMSVYVAALTWGDQGFLVPVVANPGQTCAVLGRGFIRRFDITLTLDSESVSVTRREKPATVEVSIGIDPGSVVLLPEGESPGPRIRKTHRNLRRQK